MAAPSPWTFPTDARTNLLNGTYGALNSGSWKVALVTSSSNIGSATTTWAGVTNEVASGNGYTTGGIAVTLNLSGTTSVTVDFATNPTWTATGGSIVAEYAVLYLVSGDVLAYSALDGTPASVTISTGNSLTIDSNGTPGPVLTLA